MLNNFIRKFREKKGITQQQLADSCSVSRQTIIAMEKGNYEPSLSLALKLTKFFSIKVEELFHLK